jgi:hypothetical protein
MAVACYAAVVVACLAVILGRYRSVEA